MSPHVSIGPHVSISPHVTVESHKVVIAVLIDISAAAIVNLTSDVQVDIHAAVGTVVARVLYRFVGVDHSSALLENAVSKSPVIVNRRSS
ncbi:MAG: hypothetical protein ACR2QT_15315 [Woeseiaceae bacterium]